MANLNLCQFIGNVGNCETKYTADGKAIFNVSIAVNEKWKGKDGTPHERTEWVRGVAFGKLAEIMSKYVKKGDSLYIAGKLKTDKYQAPDGSDRYSTSIVIDQMQMLSSRQGSTENAPSQPTREAVQGNTAPVDDGFVDSKIPF